MNIAEYHAPAPQGRESTGEAWPWVPDQGNGTYRNPVLLSDYSDPDAIRVGDDYYLISSSFNCTPGLPILHSKDLVNWTIINHAIKNLPDARYAEVQPGQGVWAPAIRHHAGKFWIFFPTPDEGIYVTTATDPAGKWSQPHLLLPGKGLIDPCPLWDDDGKAYIVFAYALSRSGIRNKLHVRPMDAEATQVLGNGKIVAEINPSMPALEGPKFHKRNGWYYVSAPSGGVAMGWQTIFRSRHIYGPYEEKIVLAQRGTSVNGPHQGALVDTADGAWWFLHFQDRDVYGRIVHLQPVRWENDWPLIGEAQDAEGVGRPVSSHAKPVNNAKHRIAIPQTCDDFRQKALGLQWQWYANHDDAWYSLGARRNHLRLYPQFIASDELTKMRNLLLQKFPASEFEIETKIEIPAGHPSLAAGLAVVGTEFAALDVRAHEQGCQVRLLTGTEVLADHIVRGRSVTLKLRVECGGICRFGIGEPSRNFYQLGPAWHARPGRWIGAKAGLYCKSNDLLDLSGHADFAYFRFQPICEKLNGAAFEFPNTEDSRTPVAARKTARKTSANHARKKNGAR